MGMSTKAMWTHDPRAREAASTQPHDVSAGYKRTGAGVVPVDWDVTRIDAHASVKTGAKNTQDREDDGIYPFFVRSQQVERINSYSYDGAAVLTAGDGVGTGKVFHYIDGRFDFHQRVYRIADFSEHLVGRYFFYQFSTRFYDRIMSMTAKSSVDSVRMEMIAGMQVPLPSVSEQCAIAQALSDADGLHRALEALIAKKKAVKHATMQQLLTGKTRLPGFSEEWVTKRLGDFVTFLRRGTNSRAELSNSGAVRYLHYGDIHTSREVILDLRNTPMPYLSVDRARTLDRLEDGDLVLVDASEDLHGVGKSVEIAGVDGTKVVAGLHSIAARFDKAILADGFKAYLQFCPAFRDHLKRRAAGTKVYATNRAHVESVEMKLPALEEQAAIARILSDMDREIAALEALREKTHAIKQGMMQQLLTGRVRLVKLASAEANA
jgi:type I restriction enzyme S subunit